MNVFAVVVTYNRCDLLKECIKRLSSQTYSPKKIIIVNNASSDQTLEYLETLDSQHINIINNTENLGGAGGFSVGMDFAFSHGADYVWMMDDDAMPHTDALAKLMEHVTPDHIYGSLAVNAEDTAWTTSLIAENKVVHLKAEVPQLAEVHTLPFLGFLTSKEIYRKIGLPDTSYFIAADDVEYCMRAQQAGFKIYICGDSQIEHPKSDRYEFSFLAKNLICLKLVPWKRYYDTRNRILISKKYYGARLYTQTLPASFVRLLAALINEKNRLAQIKAFFLGLYDGFFNKLGKRHDYWGL